MKKFFGILKHSVTISRKVAFKLDISDFKQMTTEGATTATVTREDWREYVCECSSNSKMQSCIQNGIDR